MNTPVLFLLFNRPDTTAKVFAAIKKAMPAILYVAADGPRTGNASDILLCQQTRKIIDQVDWECSVYTLFRKENLGCRKAVSSAINWFFAQEEMGIILEDDCLPDPSFFTFCEVLLNRYASDSRISHIGGANFQNGIKRGNGDYYFSRLSHVWGWAGWRRAWKHYDVDMKQWESFKKGAYLTYLFPDPAIRAHFSYVLDETYKGNINTWDYQLFFSNLVQGGLSIIPNVNLVSNIGYGPGATHVTKSDSHANLPVAALSSFKAPDFLIPSQDADLLTMKSFIPGRRSLKKMVAAGLRMIAKARYPESKTKKLIV